MGIVSVMGPYQMYWTYVTLTIMMVNIGTFRESASQNHCQLCHWETLQINAKIKKIYCSNNEILSNKTTLQTNAQLRKTDCFIMRDNFGDIPARKLAVWWCHDTTIINILDSISKALGTLGQRYNKVAWLLLDIICYLSSHVG